MTDSKSLSLAVVGHTNTGKTSLLRTLLRDGGFGEVADASATTRHVERAAVCDGGGEAGQQGQAAVDADGGVVEVLSEYGLGGARFGGGEAAG